MKRIIYFLLLTCCSIAAYGKNPDPALLKKAQDGDIEAQYQVAKLLADYDGTYWHKRDNEMVGYWLKKAAENGHAEAQYTLSKALTWNAYGLPHDVDLKYYWQKKAADNGCAEAQYEEYSKYYYGSNGYEADINKAMEYLNKSAENNCIRATCLLAALSLDLKNREDAIYWSKRTIDIYNKSDNKDEYARQKYDRAIEYLNRLGVTYPDNNSTSTSTTSNYTSSVEKQPSAVGTYTISQQGRSVTGGYYTGVAGPDMTVTIEFYDDGISVDGIWAQFENESNGVKVYRGGFGNDTEYTVDRNYNVTKTVTFSSQFGTDWFSYSVVKGNVSIPKAMPIQPLSGSNGGYSTQRQINTPGTNNSTHTRGHSCKKCQGSGKCITCNGEHRYINPLTNKYVTCPNCTPNGACPRCGGSGQEP